MFCWKKWGPGIHVDVIKTHASYQNIDADGVQLVSTVAPFSKMLSPATQQKLFKEYEHGVQGVCLIKIKPI